MSIKLELYRVFKEVAAQRSISAAANSLYLSQSAVSQSIKQLETQLQVRLFSRSPRGVQLTREGAMLYDYVRQAMGLLEHGEQKLALSRDLLLGELVIGANDTVTRTYLLPRLEAFHKTYPDISLKILNGTSQMVLDMLCRGQADVAFASLPPDGSPFALHHCFDTHTMFVASPQYPCSFSHVYTPAELAQLPLILLEQRASSRAHVEQVFLSNGVLIHPEIELASHDLLISLAQIGRGVACITEEYAQTSLKKGDVVPLQLSFQIPPRSMNLCTLKSVEPSLAARRFVEFISQSNQSSG